MMNEINHHATTNHQQPLHQPQLTNTNHHYQPSLPTISHQLTIISQLFSHYSHLNDQLTAVCHHSSPLTITATTVGRYQQSLTAIMARYETSKTIVKQLGSHYHPPLAIN